MIKLLGRVLSAGMLSGALATCADAQQVIKPNAPRPRAAAPRKANPPPLPAPAVERFRRMTPEQRERALAQLPPARRAAIEERLGRIERLAPEDREKLDERYQRFRNLPVDRRLAVRRELQNLRSLPPRQRFQRLNDPAFQRDYSPEEQSLLREALGQQVR